MPLKRLLVLISSPGMTSIHEHESATFRISHAAKIIACEFAHAITIPCKGSWVARRGEESLYTAFLQFRQFFPFPGKVSASAFNKILQENGFECARTRIKRYVRCVLIFVCLCLLKKLLLQL
jgi:hypothetical protein